MIDAASALHVADWRRRVFALYAEVRRVATINVVESHRVWQAGRNELFATHPASPLLPEDRAGFESLPVADYDAAWRFELDIAPAERSQRLEVETGTDGIVPFELLGHLAIPDVGSLDVWRLATYGGGLFIPVRDALAGGDSGTYGGGRYVVDTVKGADLGARGDGTGIVIDFNFAYNPSCAYDPAWACPLAPPGNVLGTEVPAGERYAGPH
ncbi:MAG: hypothetical protein JWN62_3905 [Acidimicrobiales bacterium]|nr:hypothetical protein [Acidimicrobiales bacterium]